MMPQIDAGERLARITDGSVATGTMGAWDARAVTRGLQEQASGTRFKPAKATVATLASMGIAVISAPEAPQEVQNNG